jgi:hypothetical protein
MMLRYVCIALVMTLAACAKSRDKNAAAETSADSGAAAPAPASAAESVPSAAAESTTAPAAESASASAATGAHDTTRASRDSAPPKRPQLPKSAVTDTGYRPPRDSLGFKLPERHPVYPPIKRPLTLPKDTTAKPDTTKDSTR